MWESTYKGSYSITLHSIVKKINHSKIKSYTNQAQIPPAPEKLSNIFAILQSTR